jgi:hypothetical protein
LRKPLNSKAIQKMISLRSGVKLTLMKKISYKVQGSAKNPYTIVIKKNNNKIQSS